MIRTHYENLQVTRNASDVVIRAAYKSLAQKYHPDKFDGTQEDAERVMKILNEAYAILSDPTLRKQHEEWIDREFAAENARADRSRVHASTEPPRQRSEEKEKFWQNGTESLPPSGQLGGLFCLGLSLFGLSLLGIGILEPGAQNSVYFKVGAAVWSAFFGYLSYWFYSGKANPRFGKVRIGLTMAIIGLVEGISYAQNGEGWKAAIGIVAVVFFSVAAWKEYKKVRRN